jgi:hypothetical protein
MSDAPNVVDFSFEPDPPKPVPPPPPRRSLGQLFVEHNPFYLLSAACMLASLLALTNSLSWMSITRTRLITLIVTLNLYEAALLAIALFLITKRKLRRDGRMLLLLQAFFLADFSFLNAEIATADLRTGLAINAILLVLAAIKIGVVIRVLKPSFTPLQFAFVLIQLAMLFTTPVAIRWLDGNRGIVDPKQFYAIWWIIGLLPAVYELFARLDRGRIVGVSPNAQAAPATAYLALPYVSLLLHVGILHWVYRVDYFAPDLAPILLGLTVVLNRFSPVTLLPRRDLLILRFALPAAAILVSMNDPFRLPMGLSYPRIALTPLNLAIVGAFFVYLYCFLLPYARAVLASGAAAAAVYVFGPSWQQISVAIQTMSTRMSAAADKLTPKTPGDWGVVGLIASFGFLALGFWMSLKKRPEAAVYEEPVPPLPPNG